MILLGYARSNRDTCTRVRVIDRRTRGKKNYPTLDIKLFYIEITDNKCGYTFNLFIYIFKLLVYIYATFIYIFTSCLFIYAFHLFIYTPLRPFTFSFPLVYISL